MEKRTHYFQKSPEKFSDKDSAKLDSARALEGKLRVSIRKIARKVFDDKEKVEFFENEIYPELIQSAQSYLKELLPQYGLDPKPISSDNIDFEDFRTSPFLSDGNSREY